MNFSMPLLVGSITGYDGSLTVSDNEFEFV